MDSGVKSFVELENKMLLIEYLNPYHYYAENEKT